ncbi:phosphotransferase [Propionivibrio sp.]|uniref:phosphotransferase n=1 Tax=Propionivibrio sp. TaxID=2212460 RepID=UPI0025DF117C|nr:phosphotransferase [Propionivibrio sp.]MBK7354708.1 phosphotransferase [Propionivibrio sp.]
MSSLILPDKPAFAMLRPSIPEFVPRDHKDLADVLVTRLGFGQLLCRADAAETVDPTGYYLFRHDRGNASFVKVVEEHRAMRQSAADAVAGWVADFGVRTPKAIAGFPFRFGGRYTVFAYEYIPSRFAKASPSDLRSVGHTLGVMHTALSQRTDVDETRRLSALRVSMLNYRREIVCAGKYLPESKMWHVSAILEREAPIFKLLDEAANCQSLHGDLVYGNILFPLAGGDPVVLDFEDCGVSWLPVVFDLALVLERFILLPEENDDNAFRLAEEMLRGYIQTIGQSKKILACRLSDCLRLLAARALTTLAEMEARGVGVDASEWGKFLSLHRHALSRTSLLSRIEARYLV